MVKNNKVRSHHAKDAVKHAKTSKKKTSNQKSSFLSKFMPKTRKGVIKMALAMIVIVAIAGAIPLPYTFAKTISVPFSADDRKTQDLELGDSKVVREGQEGSKIVTASSLQSLWGRLFGWQPIQQKDVATEVTKKPVNKVIDNGTMKYQYMLCSNGRFRYYTDEQFKDENTGFTSKSKDACKENNQGHKVSLSNSNPSNSGTPSVSTTQTDTYEADKIKRETEKLLWCSEQDEKFGDEYIGKVHQAQATQGITNEEFNAIVDPAYWKYSHNIGLLRASGCTISNAYPDFTRR